MFRFQFILAYCIQSFLWFFIYILQPFSSSSSLTACSCAHLLFSSLCSFRNSSSSSLLSFFIGSLLFSGLFVQPEALLSASASISLCFSVRFPEEETSLCCACVHRPFELPRFVSRPSRFFFASLYLSPLPHSSFLMLHAISISICPNQSIFRFSSSIIILQLNQSDQPFSDWLLLLNADPLQGRFSASHEHGMRSEIAAKTGRFPFSLLICSQRQF